MDIQDKYISRGKDIKYKELDSTSVLLNLENGSYYTLNSVGTFIWDLMDGKKDVKEIIGLVTEKFRVERAQASDDVIDLLRSMEGEGLIGLHDGPQ